MPYDESDLKIFTLQHILDLASNRYRLYIIKYYNLWFELSLNKNLSEQQKKTCRKIESFLLQSIRPHIQIPIYTENIDTKIKNYNQEKKKYSKK